MTRENLTAGRIEDFPCPPGGGQAFLWDAKVPGLALRVTAAGARAFVFQSRLKSGSAVRLTIGKPENWSIPKAQAEARRLQSLIDQGLDPRAERAAVIAQSVAERGALRAERAKREVSGLLAWDAYVAERREHWGALNLRDHLAMTAAGGEQRRRATAKTKPGLLRALMSRPLADIDAAAVDEWLAREAKARPARAALAFRLLRAFINWCAEHPEYRSIVRPDACKGRRTRERVPKVVAKSDVLQREQLRSWFDAVRKLPPVPAAYLQALLLTGARREEMAALRWDDVDFRWRSLRLADKWEDERLIPLTPYLASLLRVVKARSETRPEPPRRICANPAMAKEWRRRWKPSPWVFESRQAAEGRIKEPSRAHNRALASAGLPHVTLHGLRRSFGTLAEWVECPVGIVVSAPI